METERDETVLLILTGNLLKLARDLEWRVETNNHGRSIGMQNMVYPCIIEEKDVPALAAAIRAMYGR